jgi:hypothetical protein
VRTFYVCCLAVRPDIRRRPSRYALDVQRLLLVRPRTALERHPRRTRALRARARSGRAVAATRHAGKPHAQSRRWTSACPHHAYIYTCMYIDIIYIRTHVCEYVCMYACMYTCIHVYIHVYMYTDTYIVQVRQHVDRMLCPNTLKFERARVHHVLHVPPPQVHPYVARCVREGRVWSGGMGTSHGGLTEWGGRWSTPS